MVQTRSESNGLREFPTMKEALAHAETDETVWKVSVHLPTNEIVRLVRYPANGHSRKTDQWRYESLDGRIEVGTPAV